MLESAIPPHLQRGRKCPVSTPRNYNPPFPAYCARFPTSMNNLVMVVLGAQFPPNFAFEKREPLISTLKGFVTKAPEAVRPTFWELASVTDKLGYLNITILAYWTSTTAHSTWEKESGFSVWWQDEARENDQHGWFYEILKPSLDRFETVFSNNSAPEGAANMQEHISGEIEEHAYWGSMRDRLGAGQDDELKGEANAEKMDGVEKGNEKEKGKEGTSKRIRVPTQKNLCIIRSGQDWSATLPGERQLYLETMHPVLISGMDFLRDHGSSIGCYTMNLWDVVDPSTFQPNKERTFGLGYFNDLASLENWSKSHQTHIDIFGGFLMYAKKLDNVLSLRLFHEIYVLGEEQQGFEYVGCHGGTGMLGALRKESEG